MRVGTATIVRWARPAVVPVAAAGGLAAVGVATRHGEFTTFAGHSPLAATLQLAAGWALVAAGLVTWTRRPTWPAGPLAIVAGIAWFAPDWVAWQTGPGVVRILAVGALGIAGAAVAQLVLGAPGGTPPDRRARALVVAIWAATAVTGVGRILFYDPLADVSCAAYCAANPLLAHGDVTIAAVLDRLEAATALIALVAVAVVAGRRLVRADTATRVAAEPIALAGVAFLGAWLLSRAAVRLDPGGAPNRPVLVVAVAAQAVALLALAAGVAWATERSRRGARVIRRLASEIGAGREEAPLQTALVRATGDPSLRVAYPLADRSAWVDGDGGPAATPARGAGRSVTAIRREGRTIAAVVHDPAALDGRALEREIGTAARLAVDNERLRAETRAQLRELRTSRARIVSTGDAERRRLERDLHDGAQQRLVSLSVALGMARAGLDSGAQQRLDEAGASLRAALADLRELAHGIHPVQLTEEGLAAAVEALAVRARIPVRITVLSEERQPTAAETAAYVLVDEVIALAERRGDGRTIEVGTRVSDGTLTVDMRDPGAGSAALLLSDLAGVADRIGALDGDLLIDALPDGGVRIRGELPCG